MYNPNNPSNWSWSKAFAEMEATVRKAETEQQIMNHLDDYSGNPMWKNLTSDQQDDHYEILFQIL